MDVTIDRADLDALLIELAHLEPGVLEALMQGGDDMLLHELLARLDNLLVPATGSATGATNHIIGLRILRPGERDVAAAALEGDGAGGHDDRSPDASG